MTTQATPLMQQYFRIKSEHAQAVLLFQVGDFYELFFDDAKTVAACLGIALTKRGLHGGEPIPLCGVPVHALDHYLAKLVRAGFHVAICEQLEEPIPGKVVERGVTRVLTPGTLTDAKLLDEKSASYLFSFFPTQQHWGLLFGELLTAQLYATIIQPEAYKTLEAELSRFFPDEIIVPDVALAKPFQSYFKNLGYITTPVAWTEEEHSGAARGWLGRQFKRELVAPLYSSDGLSNALYTFYGYLKKNQEAALDQFKTIHFYKPDDYLMLDAATQRHLELVRNIREGATTNTLFGLLDHAATAMGSRTIKKWVIRPLVNQQAIEQRLDAVQVLVSDVVGAQQIRQLVSEVGDLERVVGRIALHRATVHDYRMLGQSLGMFASIKQLLATKNVSLLSMLADRIADLQALHRLLMNAMNDDATKDWVIKQGFDTSLDRVRELVANSHAKVVELEQREQQKTGISSLKVRYNLVQGYYIEITKANYHLVPDYYVRQQTLAGRERFITTELRQLQGEILAARQEIESLEKEVFERVKTTVRADLHELRQSAQALAHIDALSAFGSVAYQYHYVRPSFNDQREIHIQEGRHPVVANALEHAFIPNDTRLTDEQSVFIITGPNMGGKSTYLRQVALIGIMAQCGSFVPAKSAHLPILDRIFTRIGAGDDVAGGKSTFLVEMEETALICTQATNNSLVILDEVGRGTSTFDGIALAQAVVEYIHTILKARCLFATHYHELTILEKQLPGIVNYHAASKKMQDTVLLLHKIVRGSADGSFGLEVAKMAGLPASVVGRAREILGSLTKEEMGSGERTEGEENRALRMLITQLQHQLEQKSKLHEQLASLDYDHLSPKQAFDLLWALKER